MWQLLLVFYFIFGATSYLLRRVLAQKFSHHNRLINATFFLFFLLPTGIILSFFFPHNLAVGWINLSLLLGGSIIWPLFNLTAFRANRDVDVGLYTVINNVSPLFTLAVAIPFLGERPTHLQYAGIVLLIVSGIVAAAPQIKSKNLNSRTGILFCVLSTALLGVAVAYERFMLDRVDFGAYLIYGWGAQIAWAVFLARKELKDLPVLFMKVGGRTIALFGASNALKSTCFILALLYSGSAALVGAATDFMAVVVIVAAYFVLKETDHVLQKCLAAVVGIAGLLLVTL